MESRTLLSSVSWTGDAHDNNWDTPGNWNTGSLPGKGDDVTIDTSADVVHSENVTDTIKSLTSSGPLTISGGTLSIASAFTISSTLTISGGTLNDPGAVTVGGLLTLSGGGISGSGTVTANGGILLNPPNSTVVLDGCTLINPAGQTATWSGAGSYSVQMDDGAVFDNLGTFLAQTHGRIENGEGAVSAFNNQGSFTKSTDSGSLEFGLGVTFNDNGGTVDVQAGTLSLDAGGTDTAGSYTPESGATLELGGSRTLDAASSIAGAGTVDFDYVGIAGTISMQGTYNVTGATIDASYDGTVNIGGTVDSIGTAFTSSGGMFNFTTAFPGSAGTIATVSISGTAVVDFGPNALDVTTLTIGASLTSTADITISGLTTLSGGGISGSGAVNADGGTLIDGTFLLLGRTLINPAGQTVTWSGGGSLGVGIQMGDGAIFDNLGTFLAQSHGFIEQGLGAAAVFNNRGSFIKSADSGVVEVTPSLLFNDDGGTVDVQTGTLDLQGGGVNTGAAYTIESGATLDFDGDADYTFDDASTVSGPGNVIKDGTSSITLDGSSPVFTGPTTIDGGLFVVDGSQPNNPIAANSGSTVGGSGTVGPITTVGATISPGASPLQNGPGILTVQGDVTMDSASTYQVELNGPNPGTGGYSQLDAKGTVDLAGSTLMASLGFTPSIGESFTIIHSTAPIVHTFNGLAEGATFTIGSVPFRIAYVGGGGDDVVLTQAGTLEGTATTTLSSQGPSKFGQAVTFTATVEPSSGTGTPTGTVTFTVDGVAQTPVPLQDVGGVDQASLTLVSSLAGGSHTIEATYSGDSTFSSSAAQPLTQTVDPIPATLTIHSSASTGSSFGQSVTFTATVAPGSGTGTPTGSVTFIIDGVAQTPVPLQVVGGVDQASLSLAALAGGNHTIAAAYSGDADFENSSTSSSMKQTVDAATPAIALSATATSVAVGHSVTFTATVTGPSTPTGSVTFEDGGKPIGTVPLDAHGQAALALADLPAGVNAITAVYGGNSDFLRATSTTTVSVSVNQPTPKGTPSPTAAPTATPTPTASTPPPSPGVRSVDRFGFHTLPTKFVLTFDRPLDPAQAGDLANYHLVDLVDPHQPIRFRSATYNPAHQSVTLRPMHRLYLYDRYRLTVASPRSMAVAAAGDPVDGGPTGGDFVTTITPSNLVLTPAQRRDGPLLALIRTLAVRFPGLAHLVGGPASRPGA